MGLSEAPTTAMVVAWLRISCGLRGDAECGRDAILEEYTGWTPSLARGEPNRARERIVKADVRLTEVHHVATEKAILAAGCFWQVEATFRDVPGVLQVLSGYTGGHTQSPSYDDVCGGRTGHAEAVLVTFDGDVVSFEELLTIFFASHDPTTRYRQGPDVGSQYRSAIFATSLAQDRAARAAIHSLDDLERFSGPVVTEVTPASTFYPAEEYHQRYLEKQHMAASSI